MRISLLPVFVLLMPILEIAGFIVVGKALGLWLTLALIMLTSLIGLIVLRNGGLGMVRNLQNASQTGGEPAAAIVSGGMRVIAGILLFVPGFITDILGLLLLVPAVRRAFWAFFRPKIVVAGSYAGQRYRGTDYRSTPSKVVDLDEDDFQRQGPGPSPWSPRNEERDERDLPKP